MPVALKRSTNQMVTWLRRPVVIRLMVFSRIGRCDDPTTGSMGQVLNAMSFALRSMKLFEDDSAGDEA